MIEKNWSCIEKQMLKTSTNVFSTMRTKLNFHRCTTVLYICDLFNCRFVGEHWLI